MSWFNNVQQHASEGVDMILVGNKCDWQEKRQVSFEEGQNLANELGIGFKEVSAKAGINIEEAFTELASKIKGRLSLDTKANNGPPQAVPIAGGSTASDRCC